MIGLLETLGLEKPDHHPTEQSVKFPLTLRRQMNGWQKRRQRRWRRCLPSARGGTAFRDVSDMRILRIDSRRVAPSIGPMPATPTPES